VTNAVVLWNTIYMGAALEHLEKQSVEIKNEDQSRLSPLVYGHINVLGHYHFTLTDHFTNGHLKPLNQLSEAIKIP
jgi:hypothetical protein